jgi:hypothetical protein
MPDNADQTVEVQETPEETPAQTEEPSQVQEEPKGREAKYRLALREAESKITDLEATVATFRRNEAAAIATAGDGRDGTPSLHSGEDLFRYGSDVSAVQNPETGDIDPELVAALILAVSENRAHLRKDLTTPGRPKPDLTQAAGANAGGAVGAPSWSQLLGRQ